MVAMEDALELVFVVDVKAVDVGAESVSLSNSLYYSRIIYRQCLTW